MGRTITDIAWELGRHKSTISRELKRNAVQSNYSAIQAQKLYQERRLVCRRQRILENVELRNLVSNRLERSWSPEQIVGRERISLSVPTIYRALRAGLVEKKFVEFLWCKGKGYKKKGEEKRGRLVGCVSIDERPEVVERRIRVGDWEGDTVLGSFRKRMSLDFSGSRFKVSGDRKTRE